MADKLTIKVFCAQCQKETEHVAEIDRNGEVVLTCSECGRAIKVPRLEAQAFKAHLAAHKDSNLGRTPLTAAQLEAADAEKKAIADYWENLKKSVGFKSAK